MSTEKKNKRNFFPLRVGIVGSGLIAIKKHIPAIIKLKRKAKLMAICDKNLEIAKDTAKKFGIRNVYSSVEEMLEHEDLDLVDICTPPFTHAKVAIVAMENGCHIIVEKPMAITVEECDEIIEVSKKNETKVCIAHSGLFYPPFIKARKLVSEGVIGDFKGMRIFLCTPTDYMTSHEDHWANKLTGGVIGETGPHVIYMTLAFINPIQEIKSYALKQLPYPWSPYEDYKIELIGKNAASTITTIYSTNQWAAHVDIWGTEGLLKLDLELMNLNIHRRKNLNRFNVGISGLSESLRLGINVAKAGTKVLLRRYKNTHDLLIEGFLDSIIKNRPLPVPAEEGREVVRVMKLIVDNLEKEKEQKV